MTDCVYLVGRIEPEGRALLTEAMDDLKIPYRISSFTDNLNINRPHVLVEISHLKPLVVVCLGSAATRIFGAVDDEKMSTVRASKITYGEIPVHTTYNPQYIERMGGSHSKEYMVWINDIRGYYNTYSDNYSEKSVPMVLVTPDQLPELMEMFSTKTHRIGDLRDWLNAISEQDRWDYPELMNVLERSDPEYEITNFIKAGSFSNKEIELLQIYESVVGLDYEGSSLDPMMAGYALGGIGLSDENHSAYLLIRDYANPTGDLDPVTKSKVGRFIKWLDINRRLTVFNLNYEYLATFGYFGVELTNCEDVMQLGRTLDHKGGLKEQSQLYLGVRGWTKGVEEWLSLLESILPLFKPTMTIKGPREKKETAILREFRVVAAFEAILSKDLKSTPIVKATYESFLAASDTIYGNRETTLIKLYDWLMYKITANDWEVRYTDVPYQIVYPYCARDCNNTVRLHAKYSDEIRSRGLWEAFGYYNRQMYLGIKGEATGLPWDDDYVEDLKQQYQIKELEALRSFLSTRRVQKVLNVNSVQQLEIMSATNLDILKKVFNPNNNAANNTELLSTILCSESVKVALMFSCLNNENLNNEVKPGEYPLLIKLLEGFSKKTPGFIYLVVKAILKADADNRLALEEKALLSRFSRYTLPDAAAETIHNIADAATKYLGVDLDDETTWTDDYKCVFYFKLFKKVSKVISAFIDGVNGRKAVVMVSGAGRYPTRVDKYRAIADGDLDIKAIQKIISEYTYEEIANSIST